MSIDAPGDYLLGIRNTLTAPYFLNFDAFEITPVPEPALWQFALAVGGVLLARRARQI